MCNCGIVVTCFWHVPALTQPLWLPFSGILRSVYRNPPIPRVSVFHRHCVIKKCAMSPLHSLTAFRLPPPHSLSVKLPCYLTSPHLMRLPNHFSPSRLWNSLSLSLALLLLTRTIALSPQTNTHGQFVINPLLIINISVHTAYYTKQITYIVYAESSSSVYFGRINGPQLAC